MKLLKYVTASCYTAIFFLIGLLFATVPVEADQRPVHCGTLDSTWQSDQPLELLYSYDFSDPSQVEDWVPEGPANVYVREGRLYLDSVYRYGLMARMSPEQLSSSDGTDAKVYCDDLLALLQATESKALEDYEPGKSIRFGHTVLWNRKPLPDSYVIEYTFLNESPLPLHLLHFSALGLNGEDIFSDKLKPRNGVASGYMRGDIKTYRLSYFSGERGTINTRVAPGRKLIDEVPDPTVACAGYEQHMRLVKHQGNIRLYVNNALALSFDDDEPLGGGFWGFRLMLFAAASYDDIRVYAIQ